MKLKPSQVRAAAQDGVQIEEIDVVLEPFVLEEGGVVAWHGAKSNLGAVQISKRLGFFVDGRDGKNSTGASVHARSKEDDKPLRASADAPRKRWPRFESFGLG